MTTTTRRFAAAQLLIAIFTGLTLTVAGTTAVTQAVQTGQDKPHVEALFCTRC